MGKPTYCLLSQAYPSQKPLASWTRDLAVRVEQFELWASRARPPVIFWLSGFTFPTGFLTAVLQSSARQNNVSSVYEGISRREARNKEEEEGLFSLGGPPSLPPSPHRFQWTAFLGSL